MRQRIKSTANGEKGFDRNTAAEAMRAVISLGYEIRVVAKRIATLLLRVIRFGFASKFKSGRKMAPKFTSETEHQVVRVV
jgi:hypothetical protein